MLVLAAAFAAALVVTGIATAATSRTAVLTGEAEVDGAGNPNQGDLDGSGFATITLRPHRGEVCWDISVVHIALPALAAHIHAAPAGTNGPIVVTLSPPDATGKASGCTSADRHLIRNIARHSGQYYVNVHNGPFPNGALRGQLS